MADGDVKVLTTRVDNLEKTVDCLVVTVNENRQERRQDILNLSSKLDNIEKSSIDTSIELLTQFGLFKEALLRTVNGFMAKLLGFSIPVLVGAIIALVLFIYFSAPGHDLKAQVAVTPLPTAGATP
jgi:hypothetical protein